MSFKIQSKEKTVKAGSTASILISLNPKKGIHINLQTPTSIKFDSSEIVKAAGDLVLPKNANDNYLDISKNIVQKIAISKNAKPGTTTIKGNFTYFYCSDEEGWCSKFKQPFEVVLTIAK
ncbi:MAG: hypothetical protein ACHQQQ_14540 [Bacteroidota bacterium]